MHAIAIKINVSRTDQEAINELFKKASYPWQKRKYHCTLGFIEKQIPEEEVHDFGKKIRDALQEHIDPQFPLYEVAKAEHLFGHVIAFSPRPASLDSLKSLNQWLAAKVKELSEGRWVLNEETQPEHYIPHLTLWRTRRLDLRFKKLGRVIN